MKKVIILIILIVPTLAWSEGSKKTVQKLNFAEENVDGKVRQPDGSYVVQKRGIEFVPMYRLRENFDEQIQDSLEYLK